MKVRFDHKETLTQQITSFYFEPPEPIRYIAGQFVEFKLPHEHPDERGDKHWFTLSSAPTEPLVTITTRLSDPSSSFKQTLQRMESGDIVDMSDPMGDFVLPKDSTIPLLFVAGGIGITPMRSIVKWLYDSKEQRQISLLYAAKYSADFVFTELFSSYKMAISYLVSEPENAWEGETGQLNADKILALQSNPGTRVYLSGPEPMIEQLVDELGKHGINSDQLVTDYFPGYPVF